MGSGEENRALRADKGFEALSNYRYRYLDNDDVYHHEPHHDWASNGGDAHVQSESYFDANVRRQTERNIAHFSNRHAPISKYYSPQYKHRNKGFRPKTRSMVRKNESALAKALFSTTDVVHISAERDWDPQQKASASVIKDLMQYRLEETIPWFPLTDSQLLAERTTDYNSVRNAREGNREDSKDQTYLCTVTLTC